MLGIRERESGSEAHLPTLYTRLLSGEHGNAIEVSHRRCHSRLDGKLWGK